MQDSPYLLEPIVHSFSAEPSPVRLAMLSAVAKLFFKRPPECQLLLGSVLASAAADPNQDVHDRALLYYRLDPFKCHFKRQPVYICCKRKIRTGALPYFPKNMLYHAVHIS